MNSIATPDNPYESISVFGICNVHQAQCDKFSNSLDREAVECFYKCFESGCVDIVENVNWYWDAVEYYGPYPEHVQKEEDPADEGVKLATVGEKVF